MRIWLLLVAGFVLTTAAAGQRIAVLSPDGSDASRGFADKLTASLSPTIKVLDGALASAAFESQSFASPFNLSLEEARRAGQAIGCDLYVLVHSGIQRRSSSTRPEYYEGYAVLFLVSTRSGRLVSETYEVHAADKPAEAQKQLEDVVPATAAAIAKTARAIHAAELNEKQPPSLEEPPEEGSSTGDFRAPVPYRRVKPEYTDLANSFSVAATVDLVVDLDADGHILRTEAARWAGYGLDAAAVKAVTSMNWRPAERDGNFIPMRFLVRYNFKKAEKPPKP